MTEIAQHFFHLSGIHATLPTIEVLSILESEKSNYSIIEKQNQCLIVNCDKISAFKVAKRAAYCRRSVHLILRRNASGLRLEEIVDSINRNVDFNLYLNSGQSFRVRVYRIGKSSKEFLSITLENEIGKIIWKQTENKCKGQMKDPDITFVLLFSGEEFLFGSEIFAKPKGSFEKRRPDLRPFFKPGTLEPRFARLMVNLAQAAPGEFLLDPFCGPGGILIEGALTGCKLIGSDLDKKMIMGAKQNIDYFTPTINFSFLQADAKELPFKNRIKSIATDPPYGRSTSTYGKEITELLSNFFEEAYSILVPDGIISIGMFEEIPISEIATKAGFQVEHIEKIYIHKSLTRTIGVCRKK